MICLTRRLNKDEIAVNPDHIVYMYRGVTYEPWAADRPKGPPQIASTWTVLVLSYTGGSDRTDLDVSETMDTILERIRTFRKEC